MTTSMYFSAERVQLLRGKFNKDKLVITGLFNEALPEGAIVNGVIVNDIAVTNAVKSLVERSKTGKRFIDVVVDSSSILTTTLRVPFLSRSRLLKLAQEEFAEVADNYEELIYDYGVIARKNRSEEGGAILCAAMESTFAFAYIDIFNQLDLRLNSIDLALSGVIALVDYIPELRDKTCVFALLENQVITLYLFVAGEYRYTLRRSLKAERGGADSPAEISQVLDALLTYYKSLKIESDISDIYFAGLHSDEYDLMVSLAEKYPQHVCALPDFPVIEPEAGINYRLAHNFYGTGNLLIKDGSYHG